MAHVETNVAIDSFQGKFKRNDRIVYRTRNGRTHAYAFDHPFRGTASEEQAQTRSTFGMAVKQASAILKDPEQKADWGAVMPPTASITAPPLPLATTPPSAASSSPPSTPN